jgi:hypothetical protein
MGAKVAPPPLTWPSEASLSYIENTWLAYAFEHPADRDEIDRSLERVRDHYSELYAEPVRAHSHVASTFGMALWRRDDPRLHWPSWAEDDQWAVATTNAIAGTERDVAATGAPIRLGSLLARDPERLAELTPPFALGALDKQTDRLVIVNDFLASARLYEMEIRDGWVWSNRAGALSLFAGLEPELDTDAWAIHAATGWFLGATTPFRGATKVRPGSAISIQGSPSGATVSHTQTGAVRQLIRPRRGSLKRQAKAAAKQSVDLARSIGEIWDVEPTINLSGGRDSRISAAGAVVAGLDAKFRTMDIEPGEVEAAQQLLAAVPGPFKHSVLTMERGTPDDSLDERIRASHLVHDGVANPMGGQGSVDLPQEGFVAPLVTGHGGELGHGFYYDRSSLRRQLLPATRSRLIARLERSGRQKANAAREDAYALYLAEVERTLDEGRAYGIRGASLLDYYYLAQRLPYRAGLGTRNDRYSACVTPAFVRGCFDLNPAGRTGAKFHKAVIDELLPAWSEIPFFHGGGGRMRPMKRPRIWEKPRHADEMEEMIASPELWGEVFDPSRVQEMWRKAKTGEGHSHYEATFMRIAWRVCFVEHMRRLGSRSTSVASTHSRPS